MPWITGALIWGWHMFGTFSTFLLFKLMYMHVLSLGIYRRSPILLLLTRNFLLVILAPNIFLSSHKILFTLMFVSLFFGAFFLASIQSQYNTNGSKIGAKHLYLKGQNSYFIIYIKNDSQRNSECNKIYIFLNFVVATMLLLKTKKFF